MTAQNYMNQRIEQVLDANRGYFGAPRRTDWNRVMNGLFGDVLDRAQSSNRSAHHLAGRVAQMEALAKARLAAAQHPRSKELKGQPDEKDLKADAALFVAFRKAFEAETRTRIATGQPLSASEIRLARIESTTRVGNDVKRYVRHGTRADLGAPEPGSVLATRGEHMISAVRDAAVSRSKPVSRPDRQLVR